MRKYITSIILVLTLPIGEIHTFWDKNTQTQNWIIAEYRPMLIAWNLKYAENEIVPIFYFMAMLFWVNSKLNRVVLKAFLLLAVFDMLMYFHNFKLQNFGTIYLWFAGFVIVSMIWDSKLSNKTWEILDGKS